MRGLRRQPSHFYSLGYLRAGMILAAALLVDGTSVCRAANQPNIVLILMDDLGFNDIGAYMYPGKVPEAPTGDSHFAAPNSSKGLTPRIDSLATDGARLTHFYATSPVCSPTRASLMTGCYPARVGIPGVLSSDDQEGLSASEITLPELLREQGYLTAMSGKWHLGSTQDFNPMRHGFEEYFGILYSSDMWDKNPFIDSFLPLALMQGERPIDSYRTLSGGTFCGSIDTPLEQSFLLEAMTEQALRAIDRAAAESRPLFLYFSPHTPHVPIHPHPEFLSAAGKQSDLERYKDLLREIDHRVGQILDRLAQYKMVDNTVVIFTSDNGPWQNRPGSGDLFQGAGSAYPLRGSKHTNMEGGHRVPFLIRYPGVIPAGEVLEQTAATIDLYTTLIKLAGGTIPADRVVDGVDLWPLLTGSNPVEPHKVFYFYPSKSSLAAGILDLSSPDKFKLGADGSLFRLAKGFSGDFQEHLDVSMEQSPIKQELNGWLSEWNQSFHTRPAGHQRNVSIEVDRDAVTVKRNGNATISLRLSSPSDAEVTVFRHSGNQRLSVAGSRKLKFSHENWDQWQPVVFSVAETEIGAGGAIFFAKLADGNLRKLFVFEKTP